MDWVETSWGPADLDVAHCSTALALLHGVRVGMGPAEHYLAAGGALGLTSRPTTCTGGCSYALAFAPGRGEGRRALAGTRQARPDPGGAHGSAWRRTSALFERCG